MSETMVRSEARAVGVVTSHTSRRSHGMDNHTSLLFFPSVRFQTPDGRTVEVHNKVGSNAPPKVGAGEAKVALGSRWRVGPKALLVVGAVFVGAMAFFFLFFVAMIVWASMA